MRMRRRIATDCTRHHRITASSEKASSRARAPARRRRNRRHGRVIELVVAAGGVRPRRPRASRRRAGGVVRLLRRRRRFDPRRRGFGPPVSVPVSVPEAARADLRHRARLGRRLSRDGGVGLPRSRRARGGYSARRGVALVEVELVIARGVRDLAETPERGGSSRRLRSAARVGDRTGNSGGGTTGGPSRRLLLDARLGALRAQGVLRRARRAAPRGVDAKHLAEQRGAFVRTPLPFDTQCAC